MRETCGRGARKFRRSRIGLGADRIVTQSALKKRYNLPLVFPVQVVDLQPTLPLTSSTDLGARSRQASLSPLRRPSSSVQGEGAEGILFDPVGIARREEGWDGILRRVVKEWMDRIVGEMV